MTYIIADRQIAPASTPSESAQVKDDWLLRVRMAEYRLWLLVKEKRLESYLKKRKKYMEEQSRKYLDEQRLRCLEEIRLNQLPWKEMFDLDRSLGLNECPPPKPWSHMKTNTWRLSEKSVYDFSYMWSTVKQTPPKGMAWTFASPDIAQVDVRAQLKVDSQAKPEEMGGSKTVVQEEKTVMKEAAMASPSEAPNKDVQLGPKIYFGHYRAVCEKRTKQKTRRWSIDVYAEGISTFGF